MPTVSESYTSRSNRVRLALGVALAVTLAGASACKGSTSPERAAAQLQIEIVESDADADLFVDGNYVGQVKEVMNAATGPLLLAPGAHRVEVRKAGRFPVQRTVRVGPDDLGRVVTLEAELLTNPQ